MQIIPANKYVETVDIRYRKISNFTHFNFIDRRKRNNIKWMKGHYPWWSPKDRTIHHIFEYYRPQSVKRSQSWWQCMDKREIFVISNESPRRHIHTSVTKNSTICPRHLTRLSTTWAISSEKQQHSFLALSTIVEWINTFHLIYFSINPNSRFDWFQRKFNKRVSKSLSCANVKNNQVRVWYFPVSIDLYAIAFCLKQFMT